MNLAEGTCSSQTNIVLAEDNAADVALVREAFREHNIQHDLHVLSDGEAAFDFIAGLDLDASLPCPDLLLLDLHLPKLNGHQILQRLRSSQRCAEIPVVILSSSEAPQDLMSADDNAVAHYFRKPFSFSGFMTLGAVVKDVIASHQRGFRMSAGYKQ